jgi:hypothetical protein
MTTTLTHDISHTIRGTGGYDGLSRPDASPRGLLLGALIGLLLHAALIAVAVVFSLTQLERRAELEGFIEAAPPTVELLPEAPTLEARPHGGGSSGAPRPLGGAAERIGQGAPRPVELARAFAALTDNEALRSLTSDRGLMETVSTDFATSGFDDSGMPGPGRAGIARMSGPGGIPGPGSGGAGGPITGLDTSSGPGRRGSLPRREARPTSYVEAQRAQSVGAGLSAAQVEAVVRRHRNAIRFCYEGELQQHAGLSGRIGSTWVIGLDGAVTGAAVTENTMDNRNVESCLLRVIGRMRFPAPDGRSVVVAYPFSFRALDVESRGM